MGPSRSTTGTVGAAPCTDRNCPSLGKNAPGYTALRASQELTDIQEGKLIVFILAGCRHQVLPDHLPTQRSVSIMLCCWSFLTQLHKNASFWSEHQTTDQSWPVWMWNGNMQSKELFFVLRLGFTQCFLYWKVEEKKWCRMTSHGCPTTFSSKSVSPEAGKGRRQQLIILWGNLLFYFLMYSPTSGKSLLANTKLTLLPKGASLNY